MTEIAEDAAAARAVEQARLRKERREAKIRAGGTSRLNKITGLGGGLQRDPETQAQAPAATEGAPSASIPQPSEPTHADPDEVDISQHYYAPQTTMRVSQISQPNPAATTPDAAALRQMMMGFDRPGATAPGAEGMEDDPMMKMMMQMMGGGAGGAGAGAASANNPFAMGQQVPQPQQDVPGRFASLWRLLHTLVALGLGLYIALWTTFSGTSAEREQAAGGLRHYTARSSLAEWTGDDEKDTIVVGSSGFDAQRFFYAFATAEALLLTTRFFLDRGHATRPSGALWSVASFLPQPFRGYLEVGLRYGQIFSKVKADILVCIFVLGVCSWLRSGSA